MRILVVEDDPDIAKGLATALKREGHAVDVAEDGEEAESMAMLQTYGLVLLDVMLPKKNGWEVCKSLRQSDSALPIIMLTARDDVSDRVQGLDSGADDYVVKPFAVDELLARIRAVTRRESAAKKMVHTIGPIQVDLLAKSVHVHGNAVQLTHREYELLEALIRNRGRVLTRDMILERVWNNMDALPNTVNFHMSSLRRKVDPEFEVIKTIHGLGYRLDLPEA